MGKNLFSLQEVGSQLEPSLMWFQLLITGCLVLKTILSTHLLTHKEGWGLVGCEGGRVIRTICRQAKLTSWVSGLMKVSQVIHSHLQNLSLL